MAAAAAEGKKAPEVLRVCVSGAAGQIAGALLPRLASGAVFGEKQRIRLYLLDIPRALEKLKGLLLELEDCCFPLLESVVLTAKPEEAFDGVHAVILLGGFPRGPGMVRADLLAKNSPIFVGQGAALNKHADRDVKVLVVANPANTNCLVAALSAPDIPRANFTALTRLDLDRATHQVAASVGTTVDKVRDIIIWGNHSKTMYPCVEHVRIEGASKELDQAWARGEFVTTVQNRGAQVIKARGASSSMSAANAAINHMRDWWLGNPDRILSMGVYSDGSYGVAKDIIFSFPVRCLGGGKYEIVQGLKLSDYARKMMKVTEEELLAEKKDAKLT